MSEQKKIAVYGSAGVAPESDEYKAAVAVGAALAKAGYAVMTGGYGGIMAGASQGAAEAGGHVIGVTSGRIETIRKRISPNEWVAEQIHHENLLDRLLVLVHEADGYVIMPGGLGTLTEMALAWELVRAGELPPRPIAVYGSHWREIITPLQQSEYIREAAFNAVFFVDDADAVVNAMAGDITNRDAMQKTIKG